MLYDPKWEKTETKADPFTVPSLIAWLEQQPSDKTYCYTDCGRCLMAQYFTDCGLPKVLIGGSNYTFGDWSVDYPFPPHFKSISQGSLGDRRWTFGAALERARAAAH